VRFGRDFVQFNFGQDADLSQAFGSFLVCWCWTRDFRRRLDVKEVVQGWARHDET
jgi:hypothetical protein